MITRATSTNAALPSGSAIRTQVRDICRIFYRHKGKMAAFFLATLMLVGATMVFFPRSYSSEARLFVRLGRESVGLDPTATLNQTINLNESRETEINSELEILRSRVLLEQVVDKLGVDDVLNLKADTADKPAAAADDEAQGVLDMVKSALQSARSLVSDSVSPREKAVERLSKSIGVSSPRRTNMIFVTCKADSPERAQRFLQAYLDSYESLHLHANRTQGSHEFFVDQSDLLRDRLDQATEELRSFKNTSHLVTVAGQRQNVEAQLTLIETAIMDNQRALASSEARIAALKTSLAAMPANVVAEELDGPNEGADLLRNELYRVEVLESELSARFTENHPLVIAAKNHVDESKRIFACESARRKQVTMMPSVVHQEAQTELTTAEALAASQKAEAEQLEKQFKTVQTKIEELNDNEVRLTDLTRKAELLETSYRQYAANREQARIHEALQTGEISNVNLIQPPSLVAKATSPRNLPVLLGGLVLALLGAMVVALLAEYFDPSLKTAEQVELQLEVPVLISVPNRGRHELLHN